MIFQRIIQLKRHEQGAYEITELVESVIKESGAKAGLCHLFVHSCNASLVVSDFVDESTKNSTAHFMARLAPRGHEATNKINEYMQQLPAHTRFTATNTSLTLPISNSKLGIGIWQGIYIWENTDIDAERKITITINADMS